MSIFESGPGETTGNAFETWEMTGLAQGESGPFESEQFESGPYESGPYESEQFESEQYESEAAMETELAYELMAVSNEAELEEFLGKLVRGAVKGVGRFMKSGVGKAVGGVLRTVAKTALPMVGSALGSFVLPGVGTAIGGKLGSMASKLLEAEEAEMLGEQAELEASLRYVRWARATARNAALAPRSVPPRLVARSAAVASARRYAPALLRPRYGSTAPWRARRATRYVAGPAWSGQSRRATSASRTWGQPRRRGGWTSQPVSGGWGPTWSGGWGQADGMAQEPAAQDAGWGPWDGTDWAGATGDPYAGSGYGPADESP